MQLHTVGLPLFVIFQCLFFCHFVLGCHTQRLGRLFCRNFKFLVFCICYSVLSAYIFIFCFCYSLLRCTFSFFRCSTASWAISHRRYFFLAVPECCQPPLREMLSFGIVLTRLVSLQWCYIIISYCWYNPQPMRNDHSIAGTTILQKTLEDADNTQFYWWYDKSGGKVGSWTSRRFGVQHHRQSVAMKGKVVLTYLLWLPTDDGVEHRNVLKSNYQLYHRILSYHQ